MPIFKRESFVSASFHTCSFNDQSFWPITHENTNMAIENSGQQQQYYDLDAHF